MVDATWRIFEGKREGGRELERRAERGEVERERGRMIIFNCVR